MARRSRDLWSKKASKGNKVLGNVMKTAFKVGAVAVKEVSKSKPNERRYSQVNTSPASNDAGCAISIGVIIIGFIITLTVASKTDLPNIFLYAIIWIAIGAIGYFIINSFSSTKPSKPAKFIEDRIEDLEKIQKVSEILNSESNLEMAKEIMADLDLMQQKTILIKAYERTVDAFLNDGILSLAEEERIGNFKDLYNLSQDDMNRNGYYERVVQASILRSIMEGIIPESKFNITEGNLPILLSKKETLLWLFQNVSFLEERANRQFVGQSSGVSMRIAKGLYYRVGAFKGNPVITNELKYISSGLFGITDKNLYFYSVTKSFKIPLNKIISLTPFEDGIGIHKDGITAKPQIFNNLSGWFVYNLVTNLIKI